MMGIVSESHSGCLFSTFIWMGSSWLFSVYVSRFAQYSRFYGGLDGVVILMIWIYISSITLLMGSEVNAQLERSDRPFRGGHLQR